MQLARETLSPAPAGGPPENPVGHARRRGTAASRRLERRFGPLEATDRRRIAEAEANRLLVWGEPLLTAQRLEDVFD